MRYPHNAQPWRCAASDESRHAPQHTFLITSPDGQRFIGATNGKMEVLIPVQDAESDTDGLLPTKVLKEAHKDRTFRKNGQCIVLAENGTACMPGAEGIRMARPDDGRIPAVFDVIPKDQPKLKITFNAKMLAELAAAMGSEAVAMEIIDDELPMVVRPETEGHVAGAFGLLMPIAGGS